MLAAAQTLAVSLGNVNNLGNPACLCKHVPTVPLINLGRQPQLFVGGDGSSIDNNNGQAFPCIPNAGDVFGCQPCAAPHRSLLYTGNFLHALLPFLAHGLLSNLKVPVQNPAFDAVDQETAAAQAVANARGIPFLGIRGMSDGPGDPLNLPGFPFQFFLYKQIAAETPHWLPRRFCRTGPAPNAPGYPAPRATGRVGSELHSDHDPGYSAASRPNAASAATMMAAVIPDPQ